MTLEVTLDRRTRKVSLNEPQDARGAEVMRFLTVWRAVLSVSPTGPAESLR